MVGLENKHKGGVVVSRLKRLVLDLEEKERRTIEQQDIAKATGLSANTISRWMKQDPFDRIEVRALVALCNYLNCAPGDLLHLEHDI